MPNKFTNFILLICFKLFISSPSCTEGKNYCSRCNPLSKICIKCEKEIFIPDEFGGCKNAQKCLIGENHCMECNEEGNLCKICDEGYFPDENGACSYTDFCEISYDGKCLKCIKDFILVGEQFYFGDGLKICKSLKSEDLKNCNKIDEEKGICSTCKEGYYLNSGDKKCSSTINCYESTFDICTKCNSGYYLNKKEDKCIKQTDQFNHCKETTNNISCDICEDDYYLNKNKQCTSIKFCEEIDENGKCQKCESGYYVTSFGESCTIDPNCFYGDRSLGICLSCEDKYYIDFSDGKCKSNQEETDFRYCSVADEGICKQCYYGYFLAEDLKCTSTQYCAESSKGNCILCSSKYHLGLDNKCTNVEHCIYTNSYNECNECENGFYYEKNNKTCKNAENIFEHCKYGYDDKFCEKCKDDFYLNKKDNLCYGNKENNDFYKCVETNVDGTICEKCLEDYYLGGKDNKCSKIKGCDISENENKCIECNEYYCLDENTGKCHYNDEIESEEKKFYYRCIKTNKEGDACEKCLDGFDLINGLCVDNEHCYDKSEDGNCFKCQNDNNGMFCLNKDFGCIEIFYKNCLECNDYLDFDSCTKCADGYVLNEYGICQKEEEK